jgi:hypothetical protein
MKISSIKAFLEDPSILELPFSKNLAKDVKKFKDLPAGLVADAHELGKCRKTKKFEKANEMFFSKELLEMATPEKVARHRAKRFKGDTIDGTCGLGGDSIALSKNRLTSFDKDPLAALLCRLNLEVYGSRADVVEGDGMESKKDALHFFDPKRRERGKRHVYLTEPPMEKIAGKFKDLCMKTSPILEPPFECEREFVSLDGELIEQTLWFGNLRSENELSATVIKGKREDTLVSKGLPSPEPKKISSFIYEPDSAIIRAGLFGELEEIFSINPVSKGIAYTTSDEKLEHPFFKPYEVIDSTAFSLPNIKKMLRRNKVERAEIKKRGLPFTSEEIRKKLGLKQSDRRALILTKGMGKRLAVLARPL